MGCTEESVVNLQCEIMATATRADAAAFVHSDADELHGHLGHLARLLVKLAGQRVCAELREPTVEEPFAPLWIVEGRPAALPCGRTASETTSPQLKVPAAASLRKPERLKDGIGWTPRPRQRNSSSLEPQSITAGTDKKLQPKATQPRRGLMRQLGRSFFGRCTAVTRRCTRVHK